jgi:DNA-binding SARP family transcriptional activator
VLIAIGTGTWGAAAEIVSQLAGHTREPEIEVILALKDVEDGRLPEALDRLDGIDEMRVGPRARAMLRYGRYRANWWAGNLGEAVKALRDLRTDPETPEIIRDVAESHLMLFGDDTVDLAKAAGVLAQSAQAQVVGGLHFFAGITQHNAMVVALARGKIRDALRWGNEALVQLGEAGSAPQGVHATHALLAHCHAELGYVREAAESIALALSGGPEDLDVYAEVAYYQAVTGSVEDAELTCRRADELERIVPTERMQQTALAIARARTSIAAGRTHEAETLLATLEPAGIATRSTVFFLRALSAASLGQSHVSMALALAGLQTSELEGSARWRSRLRITHAAAALDGRELSSAIHEARNLGLLGVVDCAEAIVSALHLLNPPPSELHESVALYPTAWLPVLRRRLAFGLTPAGVAAAKLMDEHGERKDVGRLRAYERTYLSGHRALGLGRSLARRTAPQLHIHDLGPGWFEVGDRHVRLTSIRRRAATVLGYLLTRPHGTASRDQVLESMWPDLDPGAALNSLNQTLYFLRREIEPGYDDDLSVNYVRLEGELIWLDPELTANDSAHFADSATAAVASGPSRLERIIECVRSYSGRFLPEFEYEEWAIAWRERLHGSFLHLVNAAQLDLVGLGRHSEAIDLTHHALSIDPANPALERALVWLYANVGASTAASQQYQHYASNFRNELGLEPPSIEDLVKAPLLESSKE